MAGYALGRDGAMVPVWEYGDGNVDLNGNGSHNNRVAHYFDYATGSTQNLGLALATKYSWSRRPITVLGSRFLLLVEELAQSDDLNWDGDREDMVVCIFDPEDGLPRSLGVAVDDNVPFKTDAQWGNLVSFMVPEDENGATDLNGDGDAEDDIVFVYDAHADQLINTTIAGQCLNLDGGRAMLTIQESEVGQDLNGDGIITGVARVAHTYDVRTGQLTNLGLTLGVPYYGSVAMVRGRYAAASVREAYHGDQDLNGDGDTEDCVLFLHDLQTGLTVNTELASYWSNRSITLEQGLALFPVLEGSQGYADLNGDGDCLDRVVFRYDLHAGVATNLGLTGGGAGPRGGTYSPIRVSEANHWETDLNGDGDADDIVYSMYDHLRGATYPLGLACKDYHEADRDKILLHVSEIDQGTDLNGDGDADDRRVLHIVDVRRRTVVNTGRAQSFGGTFTAPVGHQVGSPLVGFQVDEALDGRDHDGDGRLEDVIAHVYDMDLGVPISLAVRTGPSADSVVLGKRMLFQAREVPGVDWNGDGDSQDAIAVILHRLW